MRLIDADALYMDIIHRFDYCDDFLEMLESAPTADVPHWIPCNERLPEKDRLYLVSGGGEVWMCFFEKNYNHKWINPLDCPTVKAWMPLPEPYKEG